MTSRRTSPLTLVALAVALLALLLAASATSYAAGLARNSVGTVQLKAGAVTSAKIKDGAVTGADVQTGGLTGADLRNGSVGAADLAAGVLPRSTKFNRSSIPDTGGEVPAVSAHGIAVVMTCDATNHNIDLNVRGVTEAGVELVGALNRENTTNTLSYPVFQSGGVQLAVNATSAGSNGRVVFDGTARALPGGDLVHLTVAGRVQRLISAPTSCDVRVTMTPLP